MIDIKLIRENPQLVKENIKKKFQNQKLPLVDKVKILDEDWRKLKSQTDSLRAGRNKISKEISEAIKSKDKKKADKLMKEAKSIPKKIEQLELKSIKLESQIREIMYQIPNIIQKSVPIGKDSSQNKEIKKIGNPRKFDFEPKNHVELAEHLGIADFDTSAKVSGSGFYYLLGDLALLNQALIRFGIEKMAKAGYKYIETPLMIHEEVLNGVYSTEEINEMSYKIQNEDLFLIATSEHSLIGYYKNKTLPLKNLPAKNTSYSMCFRKEIGSHGINEKGLFRTHQFNKVEMVVVCHPDDSYKLYDEMLNISVKIYKELGIPTRILECCSGDLANLKAKSCDIEFFSPVEKAYKEIGSLTNMEEAQARRLNIKFTDKNGERKFAHTLNNTAIATSRAMRAILENYQTKNREVEIPKVLQPYMFDKKIIKKQN